MRNRYCIASLAVAFALIGQATIARKADPSTESYLSANGAWRLTVRPPDLISQSAYWHDLVAKRPHPGGAPGSIQSSATAQLERLNAGTWQSVWKKSLANDVAPMQAVVSNDGRTITFDDWFRAGKGAHAIAVYDASGNLRRTLRLSDFLPRAYIHALPVDGEGSIHWRGEPRMDEERREIVVPVVVPSRDPSSFSKPSHIDFRFRLDDGQPIAITARAGPTPSSKLWKSMPGSRRWRKRNESA